MNRILRLILALLLSIVSLSASLDAEACTRFIYRGAADQVLTARSMDWKSDVETNLWIFPRGADRNGQAGPNSLKWTSKYGSIIASGYDISTTDGMNEKGLVANILWLVESSYPKYSKEKPALALSLWGQYVLDRKSVV